jgi:toxin ParE1/3/4
MAKIEWTSRALADLQQIHDYIAQSLQFSPGMGRKVPEMNRPSIRELIFQSYRIIYEIEGNLVRIVTIIHGSRILRL